MQAACSRRGASACAPAGFSERVADAAGQAADSDSSDEEASWIKALRTHDMVRGEVERLRGEERWREIS